MNSAQAQSELDEKFKMIPQQSGVKVVDQGYLANEDESLRLEIAQIPSGVQLTYVDPTNQVVVELVVRPGLVDILFDHLTSDHTVITFIFENHGFWSGLKLYGASLGTVLRGLFADREDLMFDLGWNG